MSDRSQLRPRLALTVFAIMVLLAVVAGLWMMLRVGESLPRPGASLPGPGSKTYQEMVSAFYGGVATLEVDAPLSLAQTKLTRATQLAPEEPAAWADLGLVQLRLKDYDSAERNLKRARGLAPENGAIEQLLGLLASERGRFEEAITHLRRAVELEPGDLKARFTLAREVERLGGPGSEAEAQRLLESILKRDPENLDVLIERARLAIKRSDTPAFRETIDRLGKQAATWPLASQSPFQLLEKAEQAGPRLGNPLQRLRNSIVRLPSFRESLLAVELPTGVVGVPIENFLKLPPPRSTPAPADDRLAFAVEPIPVGDETRWDSLLATPLTKDGPPVVLVANGKEVRRADEAGLVLPFPGGPEARPPSAWGVLALDVNSDFRMDFALAGSAGLRLFQQKEDGSFADVTAATGLDASVRDADAFGAWAVDVEMDGDLDIVLGLRSGPPPVLRNNGDGTFRVLHPFEGATDLRDFAWADFDQDGDPDAVLLDARGVLRFSTNERSGQFRPRPGPTGLARKVVALAVADMNGDGALDVLALHDDGAISRISDKNEGQGWDVAGIVRPKAIDGGATRLLVADLDNNGALDLIGSGSSGSWISLLGDDKNGIRSLFYRVNLRVDAIEDLKGDGRLDLLGVSSERKAVRGLGRGSKDYHWQVIRPRAMKVFGDGRINSFGIGGEIRVRAGLLVQTQTIVGPIVHFGLGEHPKADAARIVWPNGTVQGEFDTKTNQGIIAQQRLGSSCPFLYAFDGNQIRFVTDFLWRSPLGLRINAQETTGGSQTEDWVRIRGDQLAPRDGYYDIRVTAELWETHFFDQMALMVVDHPSGTEVFVDERFGKSPPPLLLHPTGKPRPVASAHDDTGLDVSAIVRDRDGRHLDNFGRGRYQGVTRDHWVEVEVEVGENVPRDQALWLVAQGWIHPTDSSINLALGQGRHDPPRGLSLEVPTDQGDWVVAQPDLGFPAGKDKTILVNLVGVFRPGAPRRLRLRTNLEIYWDSLAIATAEETATLKTIRLAPESAELRPRGYSLMTQADESSPELPDYATIAGTTPRWRDLIGYYTRFGDVRDLLAKVDDRYVIANAGDELALRFPAPPPPPDGWSRDFIMIGDGWNKDGNLNTAFSKTVLPLPSHERPDSESPPGALEDDPVYRKHPEDWQTFHTRYITPEVFQGGLLPRGVFGPVRRLELAP